MLGREYQQRLVNRLNRIRGQIDGIQKMIEEPRYCIDTLTQIAAVRAALSSVGRFILEDHMKTCVATAIKRGAGAKKIRELMDVFKKF